MKALVLATDHLGPDYRINGLSSSFFNLQGRPVLLYVLVALDQLSDIDEIVIVGPPPQIMRVLEAALFEIPFSKKINVLPQKGDFLEDLQAAISEAPQQAPDPLQVLPTDEETILCLPGNIPLITTAEIEAFLATSDMTAYDYCIGITEEDALRAFYPEGEKSGIKKPVIQLNDKSFRLNNLHLFYPSHISQILQNRSGNSSEIGMPDAVANALPAYMAAFFCDLFGQTDQKPVLSQDSSIEMLEKHLSRISQLKLKFTGRWKGGAALNIDDETSFQAVSERIDDWRTLTEDLNQTEEGKKQCPTSGLACKSE